MNDGVLQFKNLGKFSSFYTLSPKLCINLVTEPVSRQLPSHWEICHFCSVSATVALGFSLLVAADLLCKLAKSVMLSFPKLFCIFTWALDMKALSLGCAVGISPGVSVLSVHASGAVHGFEAAALKRRPTSRCGVGSAAVCHGRWERAGSPARLVQCGSWNFPLSMLFQNILAIQS